MHVKQYVHVHIKMQRKYIHSSVNTQSTRKGKPFSLSSKQTTSRYLSSACVLMTNEIVPLSKVLTDVCWNPYSPRVEI